jgi:hypothetical protein
VDEEMEDAAPLIAVKLDDIIPEDYDEETAIAAAMELSRAEEEAKWSWPGLEDIVRISAMVAEHVANLPSPPPLPPHVPAQVAWDG